MNTKIFLDTAQLPIMRVWPAGGTIAGFTTNPTLMRAAGVVDYLSFVEDAVAVADGRPISFEVIADDPAEMLRQARLLARFGPNVYVKIPVTDTYGVSTFGVVRALAFEGIRVNVTAVFTSSQAADVRRALATCNTPAIVSIFAGRIADTGRDPTPILARALELFAEQPQTEILWASSRELLNVQQAAAVGVHIITVAPELLAKTGLTGKNLTEFSLETVRMFARDARAAGYVL